jgi:hypothetical protein
LILRRIRHAITASRPGRSRRDTILVNSCSYGDRHQPGRLWTTAKLLLAFAFYFAISMIFFDHARDWMTNYRGEGGDPIAFVWFLHWWPFAITHHLNPFISHYVWHPRGFNLTWATSVPSAALFGWPLTLLAGPIFTFNFWTMMAPALAAWTAFLLAWHLTRDWPAALVGGYLFGFSSYELSQLLGHLPIDLAFLVPIAVLLCVRRARGEMKGRTFVAALTAVLLIELGLSTEIVATLCVLGAITWVIFFLCASASDRPALSRLAIDIVLAAAATIVLAAPFLFYLVKGLPDVPPMINSPQIFSADLLNYIVPTEVTRLGRSVFADLSNRFTGNHAEQGAYLGLPLVLLLAFHFRDRLADRYTRALLIALGVLIVLSLGPTLQIGGVQTWFPLPWSLALNLPLVRAALPTRFTMYVALATSVTAALYLATPGVGSWRVWRFALAGIACVFLIPNVRVFAWSRWPEQPFFTPETVRHELGHMPNVLIPGALSVSLAWQLDAGMQFTQPDGYVGFIPYDEQRDWASVLNDVANGNDLAAFCATHDVNYILTGPSTPRLMAAAIAGQHWPQHDKFGMTVIQVPPANQLTYSRIEGDYWASPASLNWMGKRAVVYTHGTPAILTLDGRWRPPDDPEYITLVNGSERSVYRITRPDSKTVQLPANATIVLTASSTFIPDRIIHNGDQRALSVAVSLQQTPGTK